MSLPSYPHDNITPYNNKDDKKTQVKDMFNNLAQKYDLLNHVLSFRIDILWRKKIVYLIQQKNISSLLDLATGTGDLAIAIAKKNPSIKIIGADISENMLNVSNKKIIKNKLQKNIVNQIEDAENLSFKPNVFDAVTVAFGVRNFQNLNKGLSEIHRVLNPNGTLIILEFSKPPNPIINFFYTLYNFIFIRQIGRLLSKDNNAYTYLEKSSQKFASPNDFKNILTLHGFSKINVQPLSFGICNLYIAQK